jgi:hypothetical protein
MVVSDGCVTESPLTLLTQQLHVYGYARENAEKYVGDSIPKLAITQITQIVGIETQNAPCILESVVVVPKKGQ